MKSTVLLSGGMDSIALAWMAKPDSTITVDYGQVSARGEIRAAAGAARLMDLPHEVLSIDCGVLGSGDLAGRPAIGVAPMSEWWPFRNQLIVTLAASYCVARGATQLLVGSVATDAQHVDGTGAFYERLDGLLSMQEGQVRVQAPAIGMNTAELVRRSGVPRHVLAAAHSCHTGEWACGACGGCRKHFGVSVELWGEGY